MKEVLLCCVCACGGPRCCECDCTLIFTSFLPSPVSCPLFLLPLCYMWNTVHVFICLCIRRFNEDLELEDAIHTAILALKVRQTEKVSTGYLCGWRRRQAAFDAAVVGPGMQRKPSSLRGGSYVVRMRVCV